MSVAKSSRAAKSVRRPTDESLSRLAKLTGLYQEQWQLCDRMQKALDPLSKAGIWVIVGETQLLAELLDRLHAVQEVLRSDDESWTADRLDGLGQLLEDPAWELAEEAADELDDRLSRQQKMVRQHTEQVADWRDRVVDLRTRVERARKV